MRKLLSIVLIMGMIFSSFSMAFAAKPAGDTDNLIPGKGISEKVISINKNKNKGMELKEIIKLISERVDGEKAFDYMSYVYMGWRTTGGPWQNHVIENYLVDQLVDAGYYYSEEDMSKVSDDDYVWIQQDNSSTLVWAPQFASLEVISAGDKDLIDTFNVFAYGFDPTCDIYMEYYGEQYGVESIDDMYEWITEKEENGTRTNVVNGLEAELNKRVHLATNSCFTDPADTPVNEAKGVEGEVVYIGSVTSTKIDGTTIYYGTKTGLEGNASLTGKVLLSDSSNRTTFNLAKQVGAIAIMTTYSMDDYNNPTIDGQVWYTNSARYSSGARINDSFAQMNAGSPIVQWNLSLDQETAMHELLAEAIETGVPVTVKCVSIGDIYSMDYKDGGVGQLTAILEIAGTTKADERVMFMAHVQEPSACDNASGVGLQLELAIKLKEMIDMGILERPERTITFFWGDEMRCSTYWLNAHPDEKLNVVCTIDLDMVGEDPEKTGGPMRIEKTPDPSAIYNYTLDVLPGEDPYTDQNSFVRLPDSHTLWGADDTPSIPGLFLNDLYMAATQEVIHSVDPKFQVAVCPYEGGSDHTVFLEAGIPSVLTWHFTDYVYHTSIDTLDKASAREMGSVGITSLAAGYLAAIADEYEAKEMMEIVYDAAVERFALEAKNTLNHFAWAVENGRDIEEALSLEIEVLNAWGEWYKEALGSCRNYFVGDEASQSFIAKEDNYMKKIDKLLEKAIDYAYKVRKEYKKAAA